MILQGNYVRVNCLLAAQPNTLVWETQGGLPPQNNKGPPQSSGKNCNTSGGDRGPCPHTGGIS